MKLLTQKQADSRLTSPQNLVQYIPMHGRGGHNMRVRDLPDHLRQTAAILGQTCRAKDVAEALNISQSTASECKLGLKKNGGRGIQTPDEKLTDAVKETQNEIREKAIVRMMQAFGLLTPEKMDKSSAKDLSSIAMNMARVVKDSSPPSNNGPTVQIMIYAPDQRKENLYETVEA